MITLANALKTAAWKTYYKLKLKNEYDTKVKSASLMRSYLAEQNNPKVGIGRNYNERGEKIRGWHSRSYAPAPSNQHPLIERYCK